jgi:hypothetical protein
MSYQFKCRHCGSQFSLQQQLDAHEPDCAKAGNTKKGRRRTPPAGIACKRCQALGKDPRFPNIAEQMRHVRSEHADDFQAKHLAGVRQGRKKKNHRAIAEGKRSQRPAASRRMAGPPAARANGATCPTCGGIIPAATAQLVGELTAAGFSEAAALEAARIARKVLGSNEAPRS